MSNERLRETAKKIMSGHRGVLASDERPSSANKNLQKAGITPSDEIRMKYRELFINTPQLEQYINAMILHEETFWQKDSQGKEFRKTLLEKGIEIIIKADEGTSRFPNSPFEVFTLGLDLLPDKLPNFHEAGANLSKWRAVIRIGQNIPTEECLRRNSVDLASFAHECQKNSMVPVVEPEVLIEGNHTLEKAEEITTKTLKIVFEELKNKDIDLGGTILKTSMVIPGQDCPESANPKQVAEATIRALKSSVPEGIGGIIFLSGGQGAAEATINLNEIAKQEPLTWELTFSYLRAIEEPPTLIWQGRDENLEKARQEFIKRLKFNTEADAGKYDPQAEI